MNKNNYFKIEELYPLTLQDEIININSFEESFPIFKNKNEPFLLDFYNKKEKIEINPFSINNKEKTDINCSNLYNTISKNSINTNNKIFFFTQKEKNSIGKKINSDEKIINLYNKIKKKENGNNRKIIFISKEKKDKIYRKDYYYKHFKAIFGKYLRNKVNNLKNKCFPNFIFNNFSTPHYSYIGNVKELDNYHFLFWCIKDILVYKEKNNESNRQNNNKLLIEYILKNKNKNKDKEAYQELIFFLNNSLENAFLDFYDNKNEFEKINKDEDCIFYDKFFKKETGISLLEKNGFLKVIQKK